MFPVPPTVGAIGVFSALVLAVLPVFAVVTDAFFPPMIGNGFHAHSLKIADGLPRGGYGWRYVPDDLFFQSAGNVYFGIRAFPHAARHVPDDAFPIAFRICEALQDFIGVRFLGTNLGEWKMLACIVENADVRFPIGQGQ